MMPQIEADAARSIIAMSQALSQIADSLTAIAKQMAVQNEALKKLAEDKPKFDGGWYYSEKPAK